MRTSSDSLIRALEVKTVYNSVKTCNKIIVAELEKEENDEIKKLLKKLSQQIDGLSQGRKNGVSGTRNLECYRCERQDHFITIGTSIYIR